MAAATRPLTVLAEIDPARRAALETALEAIHADLDGNSVFRPGALPDTHFMRFVIVEDRKRELPALLAWETNHDGDARTYLAKVAAAAPSIDRVFAACVGYPGVADREAWVAWMRAHSHRAAAFYCAYRCVPRRQVVNDRKVHEAIRTYVDRHRDELDRELPLEIRRRIGDHVRRHHPELDLAEQGDGGLGWQIVATIAIVTVLGILALPFAVLALGPWIAMLLAREASDPPPGYTRPVHTPDELRLLEETNTFRQNQLTHVVDIKPGLFSLFTVWIVLTVIDVFSRVYYVRGDLGGITSIHFARWVIVRDRRRARGVTKRHRLLFFSNYDGSWESYLGEFIDRAASGLTAIWSNTDEFPPTHHLLDAGARDEEAFKQWTRDHQIPTQVWWTGVPDSTVQNVRDDVWLRRRIDRTLTARGVARWLGRV